MRFNALMAYGPQIFENAQNSDPDTNMIDLTLGGDISAVS